MPFHNVPKHLDKSILSIKDGNIGIMSMCKSIVYQTLLNLTHRFFIQFQFYILQMLENRFIVRLKTTNA